MFGEQTFAQLRTGLTPYHSAKPVDSITVNTTDRCLEYGLAYLSQFSQHSLLQQNVFLHFDLQRHSQGSMHRVHGSPHDFSPHSG